MIPEHNEVEVAEDVVETPPHTPTSERPARHAVIVSALAQRLPCVTCGSLEVCRCIPQPEVLRVSDRATLIEQALMLYGYLPEDGGEPPVFDAEETARWLASLSGFPRYTQVEDGWHRLLEAEADIELCTIHAMRRATSGEIEMVKAAKAALLANLDRV